MVWKKYVLCFLWCTAQTFLFNKNKIKRNHSPQPNDDVVKIEKEIAVPDTHIRIHLSSYTHIHYLYNSHTRIHHISYIAYIKKSCKGSSMVLPLLPHSHKVKKSFKLHLCMYIYWKTNTYVYVNNFFYQIFMCVYVCVCLWKYLRHYPYTSTVGIVWIRNFISF